MNSLRFTSIIALIGMSAGLLHAQGSTDAQTMQELVQELRALRQRVQDLERLLPNPKQDPPAAQMPAPMVSAAVPQTPDPVVEAPTGIPTDTEPAMAHDSHSLLSSPQMNFHGYADLGYQASNSAGGNNGFWLGEADLFLTSKLSDRLSFLMETTLSSTDKNVPSIEVERIFLTYRTSDYLNISVGRFHSAIGYFNGAFHHGRWFQTLVDRPYLFSFEDDGGLLPIHNTGVSLDGRIPSGSLNLHYVAELGNGRAYRTPNAEPVQLVGDENNGKSLNLALYANPRFLPGWQAGASVYRDRLTPDGLPKIQQIIYSAHAAYSRNRTELIAEGVLMQHTRTLQGTTNVPAFYLQGAYKATASLKPFARIEFMNAAASDPIASPLLGNLGYRRSVEGGLRYEFSEFCAWKFQVGGLQRRDQPTALIGSMQLAFVF